MGVTDCFAAWTTLPIIEDKQKHMALCSLLRATQHYLALLFWDYLFSFTISFLPCFYYYCLASLLSFNKVTDTTR